MEIYEIKNLDCSNFKNRKKLLYKTMEVINVDEKPSKEQLQKICKSLRNKYGIKVNNFKQKEHCLFVSLEVEPGIYSTFYCNSYYELMCKYILYVKCIRDYKRTKTK